MLMLDFYNRIVYETVKARVEFFVNRKSGGDAEAVIPGIDITCADFDGVTFHVTSDKNDEKMLKVSVSTRCFEQLKKFGVESRLKQIYGELYQSSPEATYDATLQFDASKAPNDPEFFKKVALLKRNCMASAFHHAFEALDKKTNTGILEVRYRQEEAMYLKAQGTGCTVIFSIVFRDIDDILIGKVFLQEFADARRTIRGAPSVSFTQKDPPGELAGVRGVNVGDQQGFVSFALFPDHIGAKNRERTIDQMLIFRNYLHYHIKCSKAHLHDRMRKRVDSLLQVLNRAKQPKPEDEIKKKTITGKTFTQAGVGKK